MKQFLLLILSIFLIIGTANAQIGRDKKYIGGSVNINFDETGTVSTYSYANGYINYTNTNILNLQLIPEVGWFLSDKWSLGVRPSYARTSGTETSYFYSGTTPADNYVYSRKYHTDIVGLGLNMRYYWMLTDKVAIVPQFGLNTTHNINDFSTGSLVAGVNPYLMFFPTEKLGLNFGFGNLAYYYNYQSHGSAVNLGVNNNFTFGLNYYW